MYLHNFYFILATFITTLHCFDKDDPLKTPINAIKNINDILDMSKANIKKKTSFLDKGKLRSVVNKLISFSKAAGPLIAIVATLFFEDIEHAR